MRSCCDAEIKTAVSRMPARKLAAYQRKLLAPMRSECNSHETDLVQRHFSAMRLDALRVAVKRHPPRSEIGSDGLEVAHGLHRASAVLHHSDRSTRYTSIAFGARRREMAVLPSIGSVGDCAIAESFFATLECELLDQRRFNGQAEAGSAE